MHPVTALLPPADGAPPGLLICRDGDASPAAGAVAAIGNFDGVHLGHQRLLAAVREEAARTGRARAILTFEPHPREVFRPDEPAFRLTPPAMKLRLLAAYGVEVAFVRRFDAKLAATSAPDFVSRSLAGDMRLSAVVIGQDFRYGRGRQGDVALLREQAQACGMTVRVEPEVVLDGAPVSSSRIRQALGEGEVESANRLLGHRWLVEGEVIHGDKRGRTLGFPTANVALPASCRLRHGIYAVRAASEGRVFGGVASYGRRPTFDDGAPLLEPFLFDFSGDLYGRPLQVEFVGWIRGEERFPSADDLVGRMHRDAEEARAILSRPDGPRSWLGLV